jgi:hypothetical protein
VLFEWLDGEDDEVDKRMELISAFVDESALIAQFAG